MAFKSVRDFAEHLKLIGYQENIPLALLSTFNGNETSFKAYSNILIWLIKCLDPDALIHQDSHTEADRVLLIRTTTEFLAVSAGIKLNPRKLYASNCATAKELLKVTSALLNAPEDLHEDENQVINFEDSISKDQIRKIRNLSTELTTHGVNMFDFVSKETINKETRSQFSRPLELNSVEKSLKQAIQAIKNQLESGKSTIESQLNEKSNLESKIQRKESELERTSHRLATLQRIRPAYLEEFEKIEVQMKELYRQYTMRIRCYDAMKIFLNNNTSTPASFSPLQKVHDSSIPILPEEGLTDDEDDGDNNSNDTDFKDDQSLLNQDIFKQVSNRLISRNERKTESSDRNLKTSVDLSVSESSPESEDLESGELEFIMDIDKGEERLMNFKREANNKNEISDEDF
ncbi:CLUMA_CG015265, isoform A [Clunio marinus]|uniref:CLUMA_CG015265, isoform A n=1 Tax=Clunio marinus TaxID=568069 RepID=A0A1J1IPB7_9DIPT|nr:CLUMA_CG015265, isoform A [Clunio marinus]